VPTGSATSPNLGICIDVKDKDALTADNVEIDLWGISSATADTRLVTASALAVDNANDAYIYAGNASGDVFRMDPAVSADLGVAYQVDMQTKHDDLGSISSSKGVGDVWVTTQPGGNYTPTYQTGFDYGHRMGGTRKLKMPGVGAQWGSGKWTSSKWSTTDATKVAKVYGTGRGVTVSHRFTHANAGEPFYIGAVTMQVQRYGEELGGEDV